MANQTSGRPAAAQSTAPQPTLADRVAALELLAQNLILVLEAQGALNGDELGAWLDTCAQCMQATQSAPPATVAALRALRTQVLP